MTPVQDHSPPPPSLKGNNEKAALLQMRSWGFGMPWGVESVGTSLDHAADLSRSRVMAAAAAVRDVRSM